MRKKLVFPALMVFTCFSMMSCSKDDDHEEDKGKTGTETKTDLTEIAITEPATEVGITYAVVSGQVQLGLIPASSTLKGVCFELSTDKDFASGETKRYAVRGIEGSKLTLPITDLTAQTTYYYRTVLELNSLDFYGARQTFTTKELNVTSSAVDLSEITLTSAKVSFKVMSENMAKQENVFAGMAYSEDKQRLQADNIMALISGGYGDHTSDGLSIMPERRCSNLTDKTVNALIGGLEPGHAYYCCSYVRAGDKLTMSEVKRFETVNFQERQLMTCETSDVMLTTATVSGSTTLLSKLTELYPDTPYVSWGISYASEESSLQVETPVTLDGNQFTVTLNGLTPGTNYTYRPFVRVDGTVLNGEVKRFTTRSVEDYLTIDVDEVGFTTAKASGKTLLQGLFQNVSYTLNYRYDSGGYSWDSGETMTVAGDRLSAALNGLSCGTTYKYWLTAVADGQKLQTAEKIFRTQDPADHISLSDATNITSSSAEVTCSVDPKVYASSTLSCHIIYGPSRENISQYAQGSVDGLTMKATMHNLISGMTYYYYAQVLFTTGLGRADWYTTDIKSFTTK